MTFNSKCSFIGFGLGGLVASSCDLSVNWFTCCKVNYLHVHIEIAQFPLQYRLSSCNVCTGTLYILSHSSELANVYSRIARTKTTSFPMGKFYPMGNIKFYPIGQRYILCIHSYGHNINIFCSICTCISSIPGPVPKNQRKRFRTGLGTTLILVLITFFIA